MKHKRAKKKTFPFGPRVATTYKRHKS